MLDLDPLTIVCRELEGDRLESLLVFDRIEALRARGRAFGQPRNVPNLDAVVRDDIDIKIGTKVAGKDLCCVTATWR